MWILRYYHFKSIMEYEGETMREVLNFGVTKESEGTISMHEVLSPDGEIFMNQSQIASYIKNDPDLKWQVHL